MTTHRYLNEVTTLALHPEKCTGCGMCTQVCPHAVLRMAERKVVLDNKDACMECGACVKNCPTGALEVTPGVGCAAAIIYGLLTNSEPQCGCEGTASEGGGGCC